MSLTLDVINRTPYHIDLLEDCSTGLCLFGAGFYGAHDSIHMLDAGIKNVHVVDIDLEKLKVMESIYPKKWMFTDADVFEWIQNAKDMGLYWDVVSIDPPTALLDKCAGMLDLFMPLAEKYIMLTTWEECLYDLKQKYDVINTVGRSRAVRSVVAAIRAA